MKAEYEARKVKKATLRRDPNAVSLETDTGIRRFVEAEIAKGRNRLVLIQTLIDEGVIKSKALAIVGSVLSKNDEEKNSANTNKTVKFAGLSISAVGVALGAASYVGFLPLVPFALAPVVLAGLLIFRFSAMFA
jgi:hypothetical protein